MMLKYTHWTKFRYIQINKQKGIRMKIHELSKSAVNAVREYETYLEEVLPKVKDAVATSCRKKDTD